MALTMTTPNTRMAAFCAGVANGFLLVGLFHEAAAMYRAAGIFASEEGADHERGT